MRLHGNARTCLHSRLLIVEPVLERGLNGCGCGGGGRRQRADGGEVAGPLPQRRQGGACRSLLGAAPDPSAHAC
jgi:hypothetical protein